LQIRGAVWLADNKVIFIVSHPTELAQPSLVGLFLLESQKDWNRFFCDLKCPRFALFAVFQRLKMCHDLGVAGQVTGQLSVQDNPTLCQINILPSKPQRFTEAHSVVTVKPTHPLWQTVIRAYTKNAVKA